MTDPIERLEAASEGSRELDALFARHLAGSPKDHWFDLHGTWSSDQIVPAYTTSLDAALALAERRGLSPTGVLKMAMHLAEKTDAPDNGNTLARFACISILQDAALMASVQTEADESKGSEAS